MGRQYQCTICGSLQVYHHCLPTVPTAVAGRPVVVAVLCSQTTSTTDNTDTTCEQTVTLDVAAQTKQLLCHYCKIAPHAVARRGVHDGRIHNRLCQSCYETLIDAVSDCIPAPGKSPPLNKPGGMLMRRWSKQSRMRKEQAVTILYCKGELIQAYALKQRNIRYVKAV